MKWLHVNTGWCSYTRHRCCFSSQEMLPWVRNTFFFATIFCKRKWHFTVTAVICTFQQKHSWFWHVTAKRFGSGLPPPFTPCVHNCFHPPGGTPLSLNECAGTLQSDTHHPSKTSTVPHPKSCQGNTVQGEKRWFLRWCLAALLQFKWGFNLALQPLM